jgi:hypothetical protein
MMNRSNHNASNRPAVLVEALEGRRLLSGSGMAPGSAEIVEGELRVNGTRGHDQIWVTLDESDPAAATVQVMLNDRSLGSFPLADVTTGRVAVTAGAGDDLVVAQTPLALLAFGEAGHDTLLGGVADDRLYGGRGDDTLYGSDGNDALYGEAGDDVLSGDHGDDVLHGGRGVDQLTGGEGADRFGRRDAAGEVLDLTDEDTHNAAATSSEASRVVLKLSRAR